MPGSNSPISPLFLPLLAALPILYLQFFPLLNQFAGRLGDIQLKAAHAGHGAVNNDKCWTFPGKCLNPVTYVVWRGVAMLTNA